MTNTNRLPGEGFVVSPWQLPVYGATGAHNFHGRDILAVVRIHEEYGQSLLIGDPVELVDITDRDAKPVTGKVSSFRSARINGLTRRELAILADTYGKTIVTPGHVAQLLWELFDMKLTEDKPICLIYIEADEGQYAQRFHEEVMQITDGLEILKM